MPVKDPFNPLYCTRCKNEWYGEAPVCDNCKTTEAQEVIAKAQQEEELRLQKEVETFSVTHMRLSCRRCKSSNVHVEEKIIKQQTGCWLIFGSLLTIGILLLFLLLYDACKPGTIEKRVICNDCGYSYVIA